MKVLYVGYYKEQSDWGKQTVNNILALESAGVDVVCRSVQLGGTETPEVIAHLEQRDVSDATHCIQHLFPEHMVGSDKFEKNVGLFSNNYGFMDHGSWVEKLNLMDEVWVPHASMFRQNMSEVLSTSVLNVPFAIDTDVYNRRYGDLKIPEVETDFKIYTFASVNDIHGLSWVLSAFHSEFDATDPVSLVLYLKPQSEDHDAELKVVEDLSRNIKTLLRLNASPELYKKDVIIASPTITETNLFELHQYCDCYVTSNAEFNFPKAEIDAAGFGNNPIVSHQSSAVEYIGKVRAVASIKQAVQTKGGMFADTNNGRDCWIRPDELQIRNSMRKAFDTWSSNPLQYKLNNKKEALELLSKFSIENIGQQMKEALSV
jgi:glycosyltransferase involved in cell wall biosynthesis